MLMLISSAAFAAVGIDVAGVNVGTATDINFPIGTSYSFDGSTFTVPTLITTTAVITSGTIDGATVGAVNPSTGVFTDLTTTGNNILGNAVTDTVTVTGKIVGATPLTFDGVTANTVYTILAVDDPASASKTVTLPAVTGTIKLTGTAVALTPGAAVTLTVVKGTTLYTDTPTDNEDQTITFSGTGAAGDEVTILFTTAGTADEVITFHSTLVHSTGTLTLSATAARFYSIRFVSDGTKWFEVDRTAVQS